MKIKEVITKTNLTDRAIRLYVENGLVTPSCSESYAGRKNIEFTDDDVKELCNIAVLRKAGFSISEIKLLRLGEESCRKVLEEFMEKTSQRIKNDKAVMEKLEAVAESETVTMQAICDSLNSVTQEKDVPEADIKLSLSEKIEKYFFTAVAVIELIFLFLVIVYTVLICKLNFDYLYPTVSFNVFFFVKLFIVLFVAINSICMLFYYHKKALFTKRKNNRKKHTVLFVVSIPLLVLFAWLTVFSIFSPNACSKTTSPRNYLVIDEYASSDNITAFFPYEIHDYATYDIHIPDLLLDFPDLYPDSTKYYYKYFRDGFGGNIFTEISAEWKLIDKYKEYEDYYGYYEEYKEKYLNMEFTRPVTVKTKGDWQCVYYDDFSEENWDSRYLYRVFAYNDKTETLRFIYAERGIRDPIDFAEKIVPHYLKLDW